MFESYKVCCEYVYFVSKLLQQLTPMHVNVDVKTQCVFRTDLPLFIAKSGINGPHASVVVSNEVFFFSFFCQEDARLDVNMFTIAVLLLFPEVKLHVNGTFTMYHILVNVY